MAVWPSQLHKHRIGWILALAVAFQIPYRLILLRLQRESLFYPRVSRWISGILIFLLIGNWLWDLPSFFVS